MQRSYIAMTTINYADFGFYVRPGDILKHDTQNQNCLTVYRNGQIVKVVHQTPLGIVAFLKNNYIKEDKAPVAVEAPKPVLTPVPAPTPIDVSPAKLDGKNRGYKSQSRKVEDTPKVEVEVEYPTDKTENEQEVV